MKVVQMLDAHGAFVVLKPLLLVLRTQWLRQLTHRQRCGVRLTSIHSLGGAAPVPVVYFTAPLALCSSGGCRSLARSGLRERAKAKRRGVILLGEPARANRTVKSTVPILPDRRR